MKALFQLIGWLSTRTARQAALLVFGTALAARLAFCVGFQTWDFIDRWQFGQEIGRIGKMMVETGEFAVEADTPTAKFPPVYPPIVALVFKVLGVYSTSSALVLFLIQSVFAGLAAVCLLALGRRFFGNTVGLVAGFGWALYPSSLYESTAQVWYSELSVLLLLAIVLFATAITPERLTSKFAVLGGASALLVLTDSAMLVYVGVVLAWALVFLRIGNWLRPLAAWSIAAAVVVSPWAVRNWMVFDNPSVLKSNFGLELFFGNNPFSSGGTLDPERQRALAALPQEELSRARAESEDAYFRYLGHAATTWIKEHPVDFVKLTGRRVSYYWGKFPGVGPDRFRHYSWFHLVWYLPVALLAVAGGLTRSKWGPPLLLLVLFLVVYPLPYYITHVQLFRYRYPVEAVLMLLAAIPVATRLERMMDHARG